MGPLKYDELADRSADMMNAHEAGKLLGAQMRDRVRQLEVRSIIQHNIEQMKAEGTALELSDEEIRLLESFRRFKVRMRKDGEVFTWQTRRAEGVIGVTDTAEILAPEEAGRAL